MVVEIQFIENTTETSLPLIRVTKSKNGKTGTATFIFIEPEILNRISLIKESIDSISLITNDKKIITKDITLFFKEGQPFFLKAIFIFKNSREWFSFLHFMRDYSKKTDLYFSENNHSF